MRASSEVSQAVVALETTVASSPGDGCRGEILVVDDDPLNRPIRRRGLERDAHGGVARRRLYTLERDRLRDTFARFPPTTVVEELMRQGGSHPQLGGVRLDATVMFCDLRSFTSFAARASAERVLAVLNRYLDEMTDAEVDAGGTLVGFLGDGILAIFGAPIPATDHADRALAAAREMPAVSLPRFNEWAHADGYEDNFRMGIGLHSGSIMSGNVGSGGRLEYAAIGDTVNTASRIGQLTKQYPFGALLSDDTRTLLTLPAADLTFLGDVTLRGRASSTPLWGVEVSGP